ncbi:MAG TPA: DinB family protein [Dehalococcoidia bacterium]|jgi:hypothetical protein
MRSPIDEYLELLERRRAVLLAAIDGLPAQALDWTPLAAGSSSIAVLIHHCADALRWWLVQELAGRPVAYDRTRDFAAHGEDAATLAAALNAAFDECAAALRGLDPSLLARVWPVGIAHPRRGQEQSGHFRIYYPLMHLAEHIGHLQLTRQLWEERRSSERTIGGPGVCPP